MDTAYQLKYPNPKTSKEFEFAPFLVMIFFIAVGLYAFSKPGFMGIVIFAGCLYFAYLMFKATFSPKLIQELDMTNEMNLVRKFTGKNSITIENMFTQTEQMIISVTDKYFVSKINEPKMTDNQIFWEILSEETRLSTEEKRKAMWNSIWKLMNELIQNTASQSSKSIKLLPIHAFIKSILSVKSQDYPMEGIMKLVDMYLKERGIEKAKGPHIPVSG